MDKVVSWGEDLDNLLECKSKFTISALTLALSVTSSSFMSGGSSLPLQVQQIHFVDECNVRVTAEVKRGDSRVSYSFAKLPPDGIPGLCVRGTRGSSLSSHHFTGMNSAHLDYFSLLGSLFLLLQD